MNRNRLAVLAVAGVAAGALAAGTAGAVALDGMLRSPVAATRPPAGPSCYVFPQTGECWFEYAGAPRCGGGWTSGPDAEKAVRARKDVNCP